MSEKFLGIEIKSDNLLFDPKKLNLSYTLFIIKPDMCLNWTVCQEIIAQLENSGFEIRSVANREITRQEAENLYYKHQHKDYFHKLVSYASTGESLVILLSHATGDPISLLKAMVGNKDPEVAKKAEGGANTLRAKYGKDMIKNEFYASDDQLSANKERDVFRFPIPQKQPILKMDKYKISFQTLWTFLHPQSLEHSDVGNFHKDQRPLGRLRTLRADHETVSDQLVLKAIATDDQEVPPCIQRRPGQQRKAKTGRRHVRDDLEERIRAARSTVALAANVAGRRNSPPTPVVGTECGRPPALRRLHELGQRPRTAARSHRRGDPVDDPRG